LTGAGGGHAGKLACARKRPSEALSDFNAALKRQEVVCYMSPFEIAKLRYRLHLPPFFPLYSLVDRRNGREYAIAFGKTALLLEAEALFLRDKDPDRQCPW
jgi:hypothetical protein